MKRMERMEITSEAISIVSSEGIATYIDIEEFIHLVGQLLRDDLYLRDRITRYFRPD